MSLESIEKIIILDLASSNSQLLTRQIREYKVYSYMLSNEASPEDILALANVKGIILSGADQETDISKPLDINPAILDLNIPILAIGVGADRIKANSHDQLQADKLVELKPDQKIYGLKATPGVEQSQAVKDFVLDIAGCTGDQWDMKYYLDVAVSDIQKQVGDQKVLLGLSGGVDSSVVGVLLQKAIGEQLTCIFVDHGLLRKNEAKDVMEALGSFGLDIRLVNAKDRFFEKLAGETDPEAKRKIIGAEFIEVFDECASQLDGIKFLAQGTVYSDVIESGTAASGLVKSHHNVGGLPDDMQLELVEPLRTLFKDEVRALGTELGIPDSIVWRQPFPGPGLGVRVLGEITDEKVEIVREADAILREVIAENGLDREIWQYFAVLPNVKSVGVSSDSRTYNHMIGIRAIHSTDGMTSEVAHIPWPILDEISRRIVNEVPGVNRVVYDITTKPPATIEWE